MLGQLRLTLIRINPSHACHSHQPHCLPRITGFNLGGQRGKVVKCLPGHQKDVGSNPATVCKRNVVIVRLPSQEVPQWAPMGPNWPQLAPMVQQDLSGRPVQQCKTELDL